MDRFDKAEQLRENIKPIMRILKATDDTCKRVMDEELGGYRGDGANDPENRPRRTQKPQPWGEIIKEMNAGITDLQNAGDAYGAEDFINKVLQVASDITPHNADKQRDEHDCEHCDKRAECEEKKAKMAGMFGDMSLGEMLALALLVKTLEDDE